MGEETSNKKTEPSNLSNMVIAIGKRKGESYGQALSLQDVFSDPGNSPGIQKKTPCLFIFEQVKFAQLGNEKGCKPKKKNKKA